MSALFEPTRPSIFGPIVSGHDVESHLVAVFKRWAGTYLAEKERQDGLEAGTLARPRSIGVADSLDKFDEDQLPAIVLVSIGLAERPVKNGDGYYRGRWDVGVACICAARTGEESHASCQRYMAALRTLLIQRPSLDGWAAGIDWQGEQYDQLDFDTSRSLDVGLGNFWVEVAGISLANAGPPTPSDPLDPDTAPWADWSKVTEIDIDVEKVDEITPEGGNP